MIRKIGHAANIAASVLIVILYFGLIFGLTVLFWVIVLRLAF